MSWCALRAGVSKAILTLGAPACPPAFLTYDLTLCLLAHMCAGFVPSDETAADLGLLHFPPELQAWLQEGQVGAQLASSAARHLVPP